MYLLWRHKSMKPSEYEKLKYGEKRIIRTFLEVELKEIAEEYKAMAGKGV